MNRVHRQRCGVLLLCAAAAIPACHRGDAGHPGPAPSASAKGPDRLGPGELVDGPLRAFEVKLPAGMEIVETFASVVYARGELDPMRVANYFRGQVRGGSINVGAAATVFDQVTVPANPKRVLRLRVDGVGQGRMARLEVRDVTPVPAASASSDVERWQRVGLSPDGKLIDPQHLR